MKKLIILAAFVLATVVLPLNVTIKAQEVQGSPYSVLTMAAAGVNEGFENWSGGFNIGGRYPVAKDGDVAIQVIYSQLNWNPDAPLQVIQPIGVVEFDLGKSYRLDVYGGGHFYLDGQNTDASLAAGFGMAKGFLTFAKHKATPGSLDLIAQMLIVNAGGKSTGDYWQLGIGLQVNIPR